MIVRTKRKSGIKNVNGVQRFFLSAMESDRVETLSLRLRSNCESEGSLLCYTDYTTICIQAVQCQADKYLEENDIGEHNHFGEENL